MQFLNRSVVIIKPKQPAIAAGILVIIFLIGISGCKTIKVARAIYNANRGPCPKDCKPILSPNDFGSRLSHGITEQIYGTQCDCSTAEYCDVNDAYAFAVKLSKKNPKELVKEQFRDETIYHGKKLKFNSISWFHFPSEGKGECVSIKNDDITVSYLNTEEKHTVELGTTNFSQLTDISFSYHYDEEIPKIVLNSDGHMVSYSIKKNYIEKICYDVKNFKNRMEPNELPTIIKREADTKEIEPYLELISKLKEVYQP
jgi:hypothetical protein